MARATEWMLRRRTRLSEGVVAHDRLGDGPALVLVHGTPTWSYLWREVAPALAERFAVHLLDLVGYGDSEKRSTQDVSIRAQARMLTELLDLWGLERPAIAAHDIGAAIALRAHLLGGRCFRSIAVIDGVVFNPWNTPFTMHVRAHPDAYRTMPVRIYEQVVAAHLRSAVHRPMADPVLAAYLEPWRGAEGQAAYFRKIEQIDERDTRELEPLLGSVRAPMRVLWGEHDKWLSPSLAGRLARAVPDGSFAMIRGAGHFAPEDAPAQVADELGRFALAE